MEFQEGGNGAGGGLRRGGDGEGEGKWWWKLRGIRSLGAGLEGGDFFFLPILLEKIQCMRCFMRFLYA